jgi:glycosyltransferase involved in cell wall biosynthesis
MTVTAILPVTDETASLKETVEVLLAENRREISEILVIARQRTTPAALAVAEELGREQGGLLQVRFQQRPFLGGAMRDAFDWASGSHVLMMASDLETDPATVKKLIGKAKDGYDIVTATRWRGGVGFRG